MALSAHLRSNCALGARPHALRKLGVVRTRAATPDTQKTADAMSEENILAVTRGILESDPESRESLKRYEAALVRLEQAKAAGEELEKMYKAAAREAAAMDAAQEAKSKKEAEQLMAEAELAAAERMLMAAELQLSKAEAEKQKWASQVNEGAEKVESGKAAVIAAVAGLVASLPLQAFSTQEGLSSVLSIIGTVASCFLFGVTYRYAVRQDQGNSHLRGGVVAAFGLVKAAGAGDVLQATSPNGPLAVEVIGSAGLYALESCIVIGFASVAVEAAFQSGLLKRFGEAGQQDVKTH